MLKRIISLIAAAVLTVSVIPTVFAETATDVIKVACVGDSITAGSAKANYPTYLQEILGDGYEVKNFGLGGAAVNYKPESDGSYFWYGSTQYSQSLTYDADYVLVMMGTNDVGSQDLDKFKEHYYTYLIKPYIEAGSKVIIMTSPFAYSYTMQDATIINTTIRDLQLELAEENNLTLVDMNTATSEMRECFPDGLHGNASGYMVIAQTVYEAIFGGKLADITVHTTPGAEVKIGRVLRTADKDGNAELRVIPGSYDITFTLENYKSATGTITVPEGKTETTRMMVEGATNLARNRVAKASSDVSGNIAIKAVDGDGQSRWESQSSNNQWLYVDLGEEKQIGGARIYWEGAYGKQYSLEVSNDAENWTSVYDIDDFDGGIDEIVIEPTSTRYVRVNCKVRGTIFGFSIYEFQVLESDGTAITETGFNLEPTPIVEESEQETNSGTQFSVSGIVMIVIGVAVTALAAIVTVVIILVKKKKH